MATVTSDTYNANTAKAFPVGTIAAGNKYTADSLAAGSTIQLQRLPKNAEVFGAILYNADLGANTTLDFGVSTSQSLFAGSVTGHTAGATFYPIQPTTLQADCDLQIVVDGACTGEVSGIALYSMDPIVNS